MLWQSVYIYYIASVTPLSTVAGYHVTLPKACNCCTVESAHMRNFASDQALFPIYEVGPGNIVHTVFIL